jgi:hypothetical protein
MILKKRFILKALFFVMFISIVSSNLLAKNTHALKAKLYPLVKTNWDGHSQWPGRSDWYGLIGGYLRSSSVPDDQETLCKFDFKNMSGTVVDAKLRFKIHGGSKFDVYTHIAAYEQNKGQFYPPYLKYYYYSGSAWDHLLAEKVTYPKKDEWIELSSPELISQVQQWVNDPESDCGLMLTANMYHYAYNLQITDVTLSVEVQNVNEKVWHETAPYHFFAYSSTPDPIRVDNDGSIYVAYRNLYMVSPPDPFSRVGIEVVKYADNKWQPLGDLTNARLNVSCFIDMEMNADGVPYVAYASFDSAGKGQVIKYNGASWEQVGGFVSTNEIDQFGIDIAFSPSGELYAAYYDGSRSYVKKLNGSIWEMVGQASGVNPYGHRARPTLVFSADGTPFTIFKVSETGNPVFGNFSKTHVVKFNGSNWEYVGGCIEGYYDENGNFSKEAYTSKLAIASDQTLYVIFMQNFNNGVYQITVKKFIDNKWIKVNQSISLAKFYNLYPSLEITSKNIPMIIIQQYNIPGSNIISNVVLQDIGNEWKVLSEGSSTFGYEGGSASSSMFTLSKDDIPYVLYNAANNKMKVKYFSK